MGDKVNEWANLLNDTAQMLFMNHVNQLASPSPTTSAGPSGEVYQEGKPASVSGHIAAMPPMYLIAGGVAMAALLAFVLLRK